MKKRRFVFVNIIIFISVLIFSNTSKMIVYGAESYEKKNILIINSYQKGLAWTDDQTEGILSKLNSLGSNVSVSVEYLDYKRYPDKDNTNLMYSSLKYKYSKQHIDLILCTDDPAVDFALKYREEIFSNAPIVFSGVNEDGATRFMKSYSNMTGVIESVDPEETIETALRFNKNLKNIYIIYDRSESGMSTGKLCMETTNRIKGELNALPLADKSYKELINEVSNLHSDSIVLLACYFEDKNNSSMDYKTFMEELSKASTVPVYYLHDFYVGAGGIGGSILIAKLQGEAAGNIGLQILNGQSISTIPVLNEKTTRMIFDYKQLQSFSIPIEEVPEGSEIINKPFSFIETYRTLVYSVLAVFLLLLSFIAILMIYIRRVKRMKLELEENHETLTQIYEELSATEEELRVQYNDMIIAQDKLLESEERYKLVVDSTSDGIWDWNINTDEFFLSPKGYNVIGYKNGNFINSINLFYSLVVSEDLSLFQSIRDDHIKNKSDYYECDFRIKTKDEGYKWVGIRGKVQFSNDNKPCRSIGSISDISKLKKYQENLEYQAYHDSLTGLYNRLCLYKKIGEHITDIKKDNIIEAMIFIDADNFKFVNDTLGHFLGDKLLMEISRRLLSFTNENCTLFRLGGDEFIYYIENISQKEEIEAFAASVIKSFNEAFVIEGNMLSITISMGISIFPDNGDDLDTLLKCADMAMYEVKERGRNGFYFFNQQLNDKMLTRVNIEKYLKKALKNNEFVIYYQPQFNVKNKKIDGVEALIRWNSPELGMVSPINFISIAEEIGFIVPLGEWILRSACSYIKELNDRREAAYTVAVNVSMMQLLQDNFTDVVYDVLKETGLEPSLLELEITESILMQSPDVSNEKLQRLMDMGIKIALDDFGTGYSSLSYLRTIPITTLKIDKSFVDDITGEECVNSIVDSIITLGHKFGLSMVAEGIEKEEQLNYLERYSCDKIQGYLFSKPLCSSDLEKLI